MIPSIDNTYVKIDESKVTSLVGVHEGALYINICLQKVTNTDSSDTSTCIS